MQVILLAITNLSFQISRTYNTRAISREDTFTVVWTSLVVKTSWLVSSWLGLKGMFEGDLVLVITYLITGVLGDYIGMILTYNYKVK